MVTIHAKPRSRPWYRGWAQRGVLLAATALAPVNCAWSAKPGPEVQVSTKSIIDAEFDWAKDGVYCPACNDGAGNSRLAYVDFLGKLWVGWIDFSTGAFLPDDGKSELVASSAALATDFGNGPEWVYSQAGSSLVFTQYLPDQTPSAETAGLAVARRTGGVWQASMLPGGLKRQSPLATQDLDDTDPRIHYQDVTKTRTFVAGLDGTPFESKVPVAGFNGGSRRWVPGTRTIIMTGSGLPGTGTERNRQVFLAETQLGGSVEQITSDAANHTGAMMWFAPEFGEMVFFSVRDGQELVLHRKLPDAAGVLKWSPYAVVAMPSDYPHVWSPEYFVHNGRSYIFFQMNKTSDSSDLSQPNLLGMVGITPDTTAITYLTPPTAPAKVRMDPEYFITAKGPYVYYNRYRPSANGKPAVSEGVWRIDTRLGPPVTSSP